MIIIRIYKPKMKQYYTKTFNQCGCLAYPLVYCVSN